MVQVKEKLITKVTRLYRRENGTEVRIIVEEMSQPFQSSIDVRVHQRKSPNDPWELCSNSPHPDWRWMKREDYIQYGRSEMLRAVSPGEILQLIDMLGKPERSLIKE